MAHFNPAFEALMAVPFLIIPENEIGLNGLFEPAYAIVRVNEGGWVNNPNDPGQETYAGITRRWNGSWAGWSIIDNFKKLNTLKTNQIIPDPRLDALVKEFYQKKFLDFRLDKVIDQNVTNIFFDAIVLEGRAVETMQKTLNSMGFKITVDNIIGPETIGAINMANPRKLHDNFKAAREQYLKDRAAEDPRKIEFLQGWLIRLSRFPTLQTVQIGTGIVVAGLAFLIGNYYLSQQNQTAKSKLKAA